MVSKLDVSELDFLSVKRNLRVFLEDNPLFTDYNFEGSALDVLNSQLAYNTHYLAFYAHMLFNEAFLDTAVKRQSVVSIAKHLNYTPKSITASKAVVNINVIPSGTPIDIFIPKGTAVSGQTPEGDAFNFITLEDAIAEPTGVGNVYQAEEVTLVQGTRRTIAFVKNSQDDFQRFLLPFDNIDTNHLDVTVQQEENDSESSVFEFSDTILDINSESEVYFLQEASRGRFELFFGDGVLGKALEHGNVVFVDYLLTAGPDANSANTFSPIDDIGGTTNITYDVVQVAAGGEDAETTDFIRRQAPRFFESQKRAVTKRDYETLLLNDVSLIRDNFKSVQVWGGEDNVPPLYGNVLVSLQPKEGVVVNQFLKDQIKEDVLDGNNVIGVIPIIMDPEFLFLELDVDVTYARNRTTLTRDQIVENIRNLLITYRQETLSLFDVAFRLSEVSCLIDDSDPAIVSNLINVRAKRFQELLFNQVANYEIDFRNPIEPGTMQSALFFIEEFNNNENDVYFFEDDRLGNVVLKRKSIDNTIKTVNPTFGTIDYNNGVVKLNCFVPINLVSDDEFWVSFEPQINDLFTVRNMIITFEDEDLDVSATGIQA